MADRKRTHSAGGLTGSSDFRISTYARNSGNTKKQKTSTQPVSSEAIDRAISTVASQHRNDSRPPSPSPSATASNIDSNIDIGNVIETVQSLKQQVFDLKDVIKRQESTIAALQCQLVTVLEAFGLPGGHQSSTATPWMKDPDQGQDHLPGGHHSSNLRPSSSTSTSHVKSYAGALSIPLPPPTTSIRQAVVAAVYVDQAEKNRRASSLIVSGLPATTEKSDRDIVVDLCHKELGVKPEVIVTKRLGQPKAGKVQPLLVHIKQPDDAKLIVSRAKSLRRSADCFVKANVYINENLTKAEAQAAYEVRCRRRQLRANKTSYAERANQHSVSDDSVNRNSHRNPSDGNLNVSVSDLRADASTFYPSNRTPSTNDDQTARSSPTRSGSC